MICRVPNTSFLKKEEYIKNTSHFFDQWWQESDSRKSDPTKTAFGKIRLQRSWGMIQTILLKQSINHAIDVGCGKGAILENLIKENISITGLDASSLPLMHFKNMQNDLFQEVLPYLSRFEDNFFDLVICTDVIAELPSSIHRLALSELARIMDPKGYLVFSTPLDIKSEDALENLLSLVETEFEIQEICLSYHRFIIGLYRILLYPQKIIKAKHHLSFRQKAQQKRKFLAQKLFSFCLLTPIFPLLRIAAFLFAPIIHFLNTRESGILCLENLSKIFFSSWGITHIILTAKRKKLF